LLTIFFVFPTLFAGSMWFMPYISTRGVSPVFVKLGTKLVTRFDQGWCEILGGQGLFNLFRGNSILVQFLQLNIIKIYLISFVFFVFIFLLVFYLSSLN
jgi:hypothetical protein